MDKLPFIFSRQGSPASALIRGFGTLGEFSHSALVLPTGYVVEALAMKGGVVVTPLDEFKRRVSFYEELELLCPRPHVAYSWVRTTVNAKYDWGGVFGFVARERDWQEDGAWYCSEHCAMAAQVAGIALVNNRMNGIHPSTLYHLMRASNEAMKARTQ